MIFTINRSSHNGGVDYPPCDEAVFDGEKWTIDISSIEELMSLKENYGDLIIRNNSEFGLPYIEIYDDYIE